MNDFKKTDLVKRYLFLPFCFILFFQSGFAQDPRYHIDGPNVPRHVIEAYLARGVTAQNMLENWSADLINVPTAYNYADIFSGNWPTTNNPQIQQHYVDLQNKLIFINSARPKYLHRADARWGEDWMFTNATGAERHWTNLRGLADFIHDNIDEEIILEAGLMENLDDRSQNILMTFDLAGDHAFLKDYFVELNNFTTFEISNWDMNYQEIRDAVSLPAGFRDFYPDMSQLATRVWYFYRATRYIDAHFESFHMGNLNHVLARDCNNEYITHLVDAIREYAVTLNSEGEPHARRGVVFFNEGVSAALPYKECLTSSLGVGLTADQIKDVVAQYDKSQVWYRPYTTDRLLWDWGSSGLNTYENIPNNNWQTNPPTGQISTLSELVNLQLLAPTDFDYTNQGYNSPAPYRQTAGGIHPLGWKCDHLPYFIEFDVSCGHTCWDASLSNLWRPMEMNNFQFGMDDRAWFINMKSTDQSWWLRYAWQKIRCLDENAYLLLPGVFGASSVFNGTVPSQNPSDWSNLFEWVADNNLVNGTILPIWANPAYNPDRNEQFLEVNKRDGSTSHTFSWGEKILTGDFNSDGRDDALIIPNNDPGVGVTSPGGITLYLSNSHGDDFDEYGPFTVSHPCGGPALYPSWGENIYVGDFDGDGFRNDIAVTANKKLGIVCPGGVNFYTLNGTTLTFMTHIATPSWGEKIYVGDYDKDGKDDLLVTANNDQGVNINWQDFKIIFNQSTTTTWSFGQPVNYNATPQVSWGEKVYVGDFDGDGFKNDFCTIANNGVGISWQGLRMYKGASNGAGNASFSFQGNLTCGQQCFPSWGESLYIGDFNGDQRDDIIFTANNHVGINWQGYHVFVNEYNGTTFSFDDKGLAGCNGYCCFPSWGERFNVGDFDGDGNSDFIVTADKKLGNDWQGWRMYRSIGTNGSWKQSGSTPTQITLSEMATNSEITVYPVPFTDIVNFKVHASPENKVTVRIYSTEGKIINAKVISSSFTNDCHNISLDAKDAAAGLYFYEITSQEQVFKGKLNKL